MKLLRFILIIVIFGIPLGAYVPRRVLTPAGLAFEKWADASFPITWRLNPSRGGNVSGTRDLTEVFREAFKAWSGVATARVSFSEGAAATATDAARDGINLISLVPTAFNSNIPSLTILQTVSNPGAGEFPGQIVEADVIFNPQALLSTDQNVPPNRFDLQALAVHEIGHLLGLDHSGLAAAAMFPTPVLGSSLGRILSLDDILGISGLYPDAGFFANRGSVRGIVRTPPGAAVFGAHVVIVDGSGKPAVSTLSEPDGSYLVRGLEPGAYSAYAEPIDEPVTGAGIQTLGQAYPNQTLSTAFTTRFAVLTESATSLTITKTGGDNQNGNAGHALAQPLEVTVRDAAGNPVAGSLIRFAAGSGGGATVPIQAATDGQGKAQTTAYLGTGAAQTFTGAVSGLSASFTAALRPPALVSIDPATGLQNHSVDVTITGTNFVRGSTTVAASASGVTLGAANVTSPSSLTVRMTIDGAAALGNRSVTVTTPAGISAPIAFSIGLGSAAILFLDSADSIIKEVPVNQGNKVQARIRVLDSNGAQQTNVPLSYTSSNVEVATVDGSGLIEGKKAGFSTLTVSGGGVIATATITVVQVQAGAAGAEMTGLARDVSGRLYFAATADHTIRTAAARTQAPAVYAGISGSFGLNNALRLESLFRNPAFIAADPADGTLYVTDSANHVIRKVKPGDTGTVETLAGTGTPGSQNGALLSATFNNPQGIVLDAAGTLWVADSGNHTIRQINLATGQVSTVAGLAGESGSADGSGTAARFNGPAGIAVEPETVAQQAARFRRGDPAPSVSIVVADRGNGVIRRVKANGEVQTVSANAGSALTTDGAEPVSIATPLQFNSPAGVASDNLGNIYVTEPGSGQVKVILPSGVVVAAAQANTIEGPQGLVVSEFGKIIVAGRSHSNLEIAYGRPEIASITPEPTSGARVTIKGKNFAPETVVLANGVAASAIEVQDTETIVATIPALPSPVTLTVANRGGSGRLAVVANLLSDSVSIINTATQSVAATVAVGRRPAAVAITPDSKRAYVAHDESNELTVIDIDRLSPSFATVVARITYPVSPSKGIAITPDGNRAYLTGTFTGSVQIIDTNPNSSSYNKIVGEISGLGAAPSRIAIRPDGAKAYITHSTFSTIDRVSVIDTNPSSATFNTPLRAAGVGRYPVGVAITPDGTRAYVTNNQSHSVSVIDTETDNVIATISVADPFGVGVSEDGQRVLVANYYSTTVTIIDANPASSAFNTVVGTIPSPASGNAIAVASGEGVAYVTHDGSSSVSVLSPLSNKLVATIPVGSFPTAVAVTPKPAISQAGGPPGVLSQLSITASPGQIRPAGATTLTITGQDSFGNTVTAAANTVTLAVIPSASAAFTPMSVQLSRGVATATFSATSATNYFITASSPSLTAGSTTVTVTAGSAVAVEIVDGDNQTAAAGHVLQKALKVRVNDAFANPVPGAAVTFTVTAGGGAASTGGLPAASVQAVTDAFGFARATATLGNQSATQHFTATVSGITPVTFTASLLGAAGALAVVTNLLSDSVSIISTASQSVVATVQVGRRPYAVALTPDSKRAYIAHDESNEVTVIDIDRSSPAFATVATRITYPVLPSQGIAITPDGNRAYLTGKFAGAVQIIDTNPKSSTYNQVVGSISGLDAAPSRIAIRPDGAKAYITHSTSLVDRVSVIDTNPSSPAFNTLLGTVAVGRLPYGVAITPDGARAYVANFSSRSVSVIDTQTDSVVAAIPVDDPFGMAVYQGGTRVLVTNYYSTTASVIDADSASATFNTVRGTVSTGNTRGNSIAVLPDLNRAFVASDGANSVAVVNLSNNELVTTIPVGSFPTGIAVTR